MDETRDLCQRLMVLKIAAIKIPLLALSLRVKWQQSVDKLRVITTESSYL